MRHQVIQAASLAFSVMVLYSISAQAQQSSQRIIEETNRRIDEYCAQGVLDCGGGGSKKYDPVDDAFGRAFGQLFGVWLNRKVKRRINDTVWVRNIPECIRNHARNPMKFSRKNNTWLPKFHLSRVERWIVINKFSDRIEAVAAGCLTAATFPSAQIFETKNAGYYLIVGTETVRNAKKILRRYTRSGDFPKTSFLSTGAEISDRTWASPDVARRENLRARGKQ